MPYDITFHPVDPADLQRFVFDVWSAPALAEERATELCPDDEGKRRFVLEALYAPFAGWRETVEGGRAADLPFGRTLALVCAAVAGYRHDFFYGGASALSFAAERLPDFGGVTPIGEVFEQARELDRTGGRLDGNYSASGLWSPTRFEGLRAGLEALEQTRASEPSLFSLFIGDERDALLGALAYAEARGLALLEAADLVEPSRRCGSTDLDRLRARPPRSANPEAPLRELFPCRRSP
ncbi:MAG: hypothetical protein CSB49_00875 [Proteobacteria bacterium]|nr:MAG: hypothetical protein CSB49_00875 [Pseudomonadota bacterium]